MKAATAKVTTRFENILFATDFSAAANHAAPYIKMLAKQYESHLVVLHVRTPVINPMTLPAYWQLEIDRAKAEDEVHREELLYTFAGIPTEFVVEEGDIQSSLATLIQKYDIDLVVMGTHGRSGLGKILVGSVAEEVFRNATYPVLTVGPNAAMFRGEKGQVQEVLFATDFKSDFQKAAAYAVSIAQEFQARLTMMHVVPEPKAGELVSWADLQASAKAMLQKLVPPEAEACYKTEYLVERGDPAERILGQALRRRSDLVVLGVRPHEGVPGASTHLPIATAHKVVAHAVCPVLTIRQ